MKAEKTRKHIMTTDNWLGHITTDLIWDELSEIEHLAEIGRATERIFEVFDKVECTVVSYPIGEPYENIVVIPAVEDLLEWADGGK